LWGTTLWMTDFVVACRNRSASVTLCG
jgi:hypothetical protein